MPDKISNAQLVNLILEEDADIVHEDEELMHLLLDKKVSQNMNSKKADSRGARVADGVARVAGSWRFIISFCGVLAVWIITNGVFLATKAFDPYPFILLNLVLSCLAAIQAPIIMMSQNRQEEKDRERNENDYKVNLKAELIIEDLHLKMDKLMLHQEKLMMRLEKLEAEKQQKTENNG